MNKKKIAILKNESPDAHFYWLNACENFAAKIDYEVIDLTSSSWLSDILRKDFDILIAMPPGLTAPLKQLYDERIFILEKVMKYKIFPRPLEIYIYENKRFFYSWLEANKIPHAQTYVFYSKAEALSFVDNATYPFVAKVNIGASGSGVAIIKDKLKAKKYVEDSFSPKGAPRRWGPNLAKGGILKRGIHYLINPKDIKSKLDKYVAIKSDVQKGFVLFQEYVPHDFEWRVVVIGDSYFAHKKLKIGEKTSGSLLKNYDNPPTYLFDFAKKIVEKFNFTSQAIDLFETESGDLLVNEMQCIFGQSDPYQMLVNNEPGRYICINNKWIFESGSFNTNNSFDLRIKSFLELLENNSI
jgi:glutathione synthase/RimK-type ligase-like ATP-grasp enzyme